jgi:imidazolonepropionase-like amidohydrolase
VPIAAGSDLGGRDVIPGFSMHEEVGLLIKAGLPPMAGLQAATLQVPRLLGLPDHGTIEAGKVADLVLLEGDPLADPRNLGRIAAVVCRGRYLDRAELDSLLARASAKAPRNGD